MEKEKKLLQILNQAIPLTQTMGIGIERYTGDTLSITAQLANNFNHLGTAFGGRLNTAAVLSAWGLLFLRLREAGVKGRIVISKGSVDYLRPVTGDIVATCSMPEEGIFESFLETYYRQGSAKIFLSSVIRQDVRYAVLFEGVFVLQH
jgi:thioesterase domain-containing protein